MFYTPPAAPETRTGNLVYSGVLATFAFVLFILPALQGRPLTEQPEARVACVAREMLERQDYLVPYLGGQERLMKPPLPYWLTVAGTKLIAGGAQPTPEQLALGLLLPPALLAALAVLVVAFSGCIVFGRKAGLLAGGILGTSNMVVHFARTGYVDTALMSFCALAVCGAVWLLCTPKPGPFAALGCGMAFGLGVLIKEPIPFLVLGGGLAVEIFLRRSWNTRKALLWIITVLAALFVILPWYLKLYMQDPEMWARLVKARSEIWKDGHVHNDRWIFYFYKSLDALLPWSALLLFATTIYVLARGRRERAPGGAPTEMECSARRFLLLTSVTGFLAFYFSSKQQDYYLLPLLPGAALLGGYVLSRLNQPGGESEEQLAWFWLYIGGVGLLALAALPWIPWREVLSVRSSENWPEQFAKLGFFGPLAGIFFAIFCWVSSRWWVNGHGFRASLLLFASAWSAWAAWGVYSTESLKKNHALRREAPALRKQLDQLTAEHQGKISVYVVGEKSTLWMHYLGRVAKAPVPETDEESGMPDNPATGVSTGDKSVFSVLLGAPEKFTGLNLKALGLALPETLPEPAPKSKFILVPLLQPKTD